jgi:hypothetical protein
VLLAAGVIDGEEGAGAGIAEPDGGGAAAAATTDALGEPWRGEATGPGAGVVPSRASRTDTGAASSETDETGPAMAYEPTASASDQCVTTARSGCSYALSVPRTYSNDLDLAAPGATLGGAP